MVAGDFPWTKAMITLQRQAHDGVRRSPTQGLEDTPLPPPEFSPNDEDSCTKTHEELSSLVCREALRKCLMFLIFLTRRSRNQKDLRAHHERSEIRSY